MRNLIILFSLSALFGAGCVTNYSAEEQTVNTPVIFALVSEANNSTSVTPEGTGHVITLHAQNVELGFAGYRLFVGASESDVIAQTADSGVADCGARSFEPNVAQKVIMEVKDSASVTSTSELSSTDDLTTPRLCAFSYLFTSGQYTAVRALIFKDFSSSDTGTSSNVMLVP